jgi:hypothetical protein
VSEPFFAVNGERVVSGHITIPYWGPWVGELVLAVPDDADPGLPATITLGSMTLKGTIARSAGFSGSRSLRVIAGASGWRRKIASKGYSLDAGVKLSTVLQDAASAAGEKIVVGTDRIIGSAYVRRNDLAESVLKHLVAGQWWIDNDGVTQTKDRASTPIASTFTVINYSGAKGRFDIATEAYGDWTPGRTFTSPVVNEPQTISAVSFIAEKGKITTMVTNTTSKEERLIQSIRALIQDEVSRLAYGPPVEYKITRADTMVIDCAPVDPNASWPSLQNVALKPSLFGETIKPTVGAKALVQFLDRDPTQYRCTSIEGVSQQTAFGSTGDVAATVGGLFKVNGASDFVALAQKVLAEANSLKTWADTHVHPTGVGPSGPPAAPSPTPNSTACTKLKTD